MNKVFCQVRWHFTDASSAPIKQAPGRDNPEPSETILTFLLDPKLSTYLIIFLNAIHFSTLTLEKL